MRRRGYPPQAIRNFCAAIGVAKTESTVDISLLEYFVREELNRKAMRVMAVLRPLKVVIDNYPEETTEYLTAINNPEDSCAGTREVPFSKVLYIEQDDFMEEPPDKFYRLAPGREVRLRYAYFIKCINVIKEANGGIKEIHCTYDPSTKGGDAPDGRKVRATLHWVSANHALTATIRLYDHLFTKENPLEFPEGGNLIENINPTSLEVLKDCRIEPSICSVVAGDTFQFERLGYFCVDRDSSKDRIVFNRTVTLKDAWVRIQKK